MTIDVLFVLACLVVVAIVTTASGRQKRAKAASREQALRALAPVISGAVSPNQELTGTYQGRAVEVTLRTTGRIDSVGGSSRSNFEVLLLVIHGASGGSPWGFYTLLPLGPLTTKWRSTAALAGAAGRLLSRLTPAPVNPGVEEQLRGAGLLEVLDRLKTPDVKNAYVCASFVPAPQPPAMLQERMRRASALGQELPAAARGSMDRLEHERGGRLRIEIERSSERDPTPERFREILATAVEIAALNARINPAPSAKL